MPWISISALMLLAAYRRGPVSGTLVPERRRLLHCIRREQA